MHFDLGKDPENDREDYFEYNGEPEEEKAPEPKKPALKPDDPAYWEEDESQWEYLKPRRRTAIWLWAGGSLAAALLLVLLWTRFFSPYVEDATQYGYVESIERRGSIFKTFEGVLIPYKELYDTTRLYQRDFLFTAADLETAKQLKRMMVDARPVRVEYKRYHATVPWRGSSKIVVTAVDTADPAKILPPEFTPGRFKTSTDKQSD